MSIHVGSSLPEKITERLAEYRHLNSDETLLAVYDATVFGSGKKGLAFTSERVIEYDKEQAEEHLLSEMAYAACSQVGGYLFLELIDIEGEKTAISISDSKKMVIALVEMLREHCDEERWARGLAQRPLEPGGTIPVLPATATPLCPHCDGEIGHLAYHEMNTFLGKRYLYMCPSCRKVLGVSHRQGYLVS